MAQLEVLRKAGRIGDASRWSAWPTASASTSSGAARKVVAKHGFKLVYDKSYPLGTQDMAPILNEIKSLNPDVFVAFSYPPDTLTLTDQARIDRASIPKVFYTGVGTAFPMYKQRFKDNVDGVMGIGGVNFDSPHDPATTSSATRPAKATSRTAGPAPSPMRDCRRSSRRSSVSARSTARRSIAELKKRPFDTIVGPMELRHADLREQLWLVGQWQDGEFHAVAPANRAGARKAVVPKAAWKYALTR